MIVSNMSPIDSQDPTRRQSRNARWGIFQWPFVSHVNGARFLVLIGGFESQNLYMLTPSFLLTCPIHFFLLPNRINNQNENERRERQTLIHTFFFFFSSVSSPRISSLSTQKSSSQGIRKERKKERNRVH